jgi:hypothetical protein
MWTPCDDHLITHGHHFCFLRPYGIRTTFMPTSMPYLLLLHASCVLRMSYTHFCFLCILSACITPTYPLMLYSLCFKLYAYIIIHYSTDYVICTVHSYSTHTLTPYRRTNCTAPSHSTALLPHYCITAALLHYCCTTATLLVHCCTALHFPAVCMSVCL